MSSTKETVEIAPAIASNAVCRAILEEITAALWTLEADFDLAFDVGCWGFLLDDGDIIEAIRRSIGPSPELRSGKEPDAVSELYRLFDRLGADFQLLAAIGSWRDTLPDHLVLAKLKTWNRAHTRKAAA